MTADMLLPKGPTGPHAPTHANSAPLEPAGAELSRLLQALYRAAYMEDAALCILRPLFDLIRQAMSRFEFRGEARLLRGMVSLRPHGGYRGLTLLNGDGSQEAEASLASTYVPSGSAWRWMEHHQSAVAIDVSLALVQPLGDVSLPAIEDDLLAGGAVVSDESRRRLLSRQATHVCLLPLRMPGGRIDGVVTIEIWSPGMVGLPFVWPLCVSSMQLVVDIAAPHLLTLPLKPEVRELTDAWLPVVSPSMRPLIRTLCTFSQQDDTLLLSGPTGSGKSRLARWCHAQSPRAQSRFEVVDLQRVPEEIQLGELFGWKKGAFTGAMSDHPGHVTLAEGGTLFVDEVDKLSLRAQAGFLQLLEERNYRPLGEAGSMRRANVRFIVGTNVDLLEAVRQGRFREDLFYRIQVLPVRIPSLSERLDELPLWAQFMLERRHREGGGKGQPRLATEARVRLQTLPWPGNLRQLDNIIRRAYSMALLESGGLQDDLILRERHIEQALACENRAVDTPLLASLRMAASALLDELDRLHMSGQSLTFEAGEVLQGMLLFVATGRYGSREEAFRRLGKENLVRHRNHHKVLRRELTKVAELCQQAGTPLDDDIRKMLEFDPSLDGGL